MNCIDLKLLFLFSIPTIYCFALVCVWFSFGYNWFS